MIRKDRTSGGGGVFLAFTKNLKFTEQPNLSQNAEMIWAEIYPVSHEPCLVCSFYRPPDALSNPILSLKEALQHISRTKGNQSNIILAGDFNFPSIEWSDGIGHVKPGPTYGAEVNNLFVDVINDFSLEQQILEPTRNDNVLDLVLTTSPYLIDNIKVVPGMSDHEAVTLHCIQLAMHLITIRTELTFFTKQTQNQC